MGSALRRLNFFGIYGCLIRSEIVYFSTFLLSKSGEMLLKSKGKQRRRTTKPQHFLGAPNGAKKELKPLIKKKTISGKKHYVFWHLGWVSGGGGEGEFPNSRRRRPKNGQPPLYPVQDLSRGARGGRRKAPRCRVGRSDEPAQSRWSRSECNQSRFRLPRAEACTPRHIAAHLGKALVQTEAPGPSRTLQGTFKYLWPPTASRQRGRA